MNKEDLTDFIAYLYFKRKGTLPPEQLLDNWRALDPLERDHHLNELFSKWGLTRWHKEQELEQFWAGRKAQPSTPKQPIPEAPISTTVPVSPPPEPAKQKPIVAPKQFVASPRKKVKGLKWLWIPFVLIAGFVGFKYTQFLNLNYVYAITDNIVVRNVDKEVVARMDLHPEARSNMPVYQKLKAADNKIYYRSIDSSENTYPNRKILLDGSNFWSFLWSSDEYIGYVNTNYVVDNLKQYELYSTVFSDVAKSKPVNNELTALYRKIIIGSMNESEALHKKFIVLHDYGLTTAAANATTPVLKETLERNVSYSIYAGLNDNRFYHFEGDIKNDFYKAPQTLMWYVEGENPTPLTGNYRFYRKSGQVFLYDVTKKEFTDHFAERDGSGRITGFTYVPPPPPPEEKAGFFDRLDSAFNRVMDTLFR